MLGKRIRKPVKKLSKLFSAEDFQCKVKGCTAKISDYESYTCANKSCDE